MKHCSTCNRTYDDGIKFCLADGTALCVVIQNPSSSNIPKPPAAAKRISNPLFLYMVLGGVFVLIGVVAATLIRSDSGIFALPKSENPVNASTSAVLNQTSNGFQPVLTTGNPPSQVPNSGATTLESRPVAPALDTEQIRRKISARIYSWERAGEARDVDSYMQNYADSVDYYRKKNASKSFVSSDKQRAFSKFSSISLTINIISVTTDSTGKHADALIDKEWLFQGGAYLSGKVRQRLQFKLINGEWLIAGEKDLKVYYVNS
ncbi:MAG: hypothetical protein ACKVQW_15630 [Pyrinomonadaceae bacterium]